MPLREALYPVRISETSSRSSRLVLRLLLWADRQSGWKVFDSSGSFRLPDGSVPSPDASLLRLEWWQALTAEQRLGFAPSARIWWCGWPVPLMRDPAASAPGAAGWPHPE